MLRGVVWRFAGLPRIRGGVSSVRSAPGITVLSSPHTRGCFHRPRRMRSVSTVFPAYAGVFLSPFSGRMLTSGLPRIRGGVSQYRSWLWRALLSSPHTRGCFPGMSDARQISDVFPAYAGVFLFPHAHNPGEQGLPRIRGGVSDRRVGSVARAESSPHTRGCFCLSA